VARSFEANLRAIEGDDLVDWLKGPHPAKKHTVDDLRALKAIYQAKVKALR
jgi:hypothetical protein